MTTACRSCGKPIEFVRTAAGKLNPVNLETGASHFIDCPQRREWRKEQPKQSSFLDEGPPAPERPRPPYEA